MKRLKTLLKAIVHAVALRRVNKFISKNPSAPLRTARQNLTKSWMKYRSRTKYVDLNKPVYTSSYTKGNNYIQYRVKGSDGKVGNYYAIEGTKPEQIGIPSNQVVAKYKVTVTKDTKVLVTTHKKMQDTIMTQQLKLKVVGNKYFLKN